MTFGKDFRVDVFYDALTEEYQKTSEVAAKVGCCRKTATNALNLLMVIKKGEAECFGIPLDIEMDWVPGGRDGTRAWRRIPKATVIEIGKRAGKIKQVFDDYKATCKHRLPLDSSGKEFICSSKENKDPELDCNDIMCPMLIRR